MSGLESGQAEPAGANALVPQGAPQQGPGPQDSVQGPVPQGDPSAQAPQSPEELMAHYSKLRSAEQTLGAIKAQLDQLSALGDTITPEDVIVATGRLVGLGLSPNSLAGMLADMPQKGDLLAQWIAERDADIAQRSAQLDFVTRGVRQQIGVGAMHGLMIHHAENTGEGDLL